MVVGPYYGWCEKEGNPFMANSSPHSNKEPSMQGSNGSSSTLIHIVEIEESSHLSPKQDFEVTYDQL